MGWLPLLVALVRPSISPLYLPYISPISPSSDGSRCSSPWCADPNPNQATSYPYLLPTYLLLLLVALVRPRPIPNPTSYLPSPQASSHPDPSLAPKQVRTAPDVLMVLAQRGRAKVQ